MSANIIAFANQKGGVGKTTTCVNIASAIAATKKKVLLVDLDPQGNATMGSGVNKNSLEYSVTDVFLGKVDIIDVIIAKTPGGYDLLPSNSSLTAAEVFLLRQKKKEQVLKQALAKLKRYDYILFDCPPSLNMLTVNALVAATGVIIPMQCEYYALEGLSALLGTMEQIKPLNKNLKLSGIVRTMYDPRNRLSQDVSKQLEKHFKKYVFKTAIPRNVRLAEAPSHGMPIIKYDRQSRGALAYVALAAEILNRKKTKTTASRSSLYAASATI